MKKLTIIILILLSTYNANCNDTIKSEDLFYYGGDNKPIKDNFKPAIKILDNGDTVLGSSFSVVSIIDVPPYYREAALQGRWDLLKPPVNMAIQAYLDQKEGINGGFWGAAFRNMFSKIDLNNNIPIGKRKIIYQNPSGEKDSAYFAQKLANTGLAGAITILLLGIGLIVFTVWIIYKNKKRIAVGIETIINSVKAKSISYKTILIIIALGIWVLIIIMVIALNKS